MTDSDRDTLYERLTGFAWEPRWHTTGKYLVRRKGKLVTVSRQEVKGRWWIQGGAEIYKGEDYGREVTAQSQALAAYVRLLGSYYDALELPQIDASGTFPRADALRPLVAALDALYADLGGAERDEVESCQERHYHKLID